MQNVLREPEVTCRDAALKRAQIGRYSLDLGKNTTGSAAELRLGSGEVVSARLQELVKNGLIRNEAPVSGPSVLPEVRGQPPPLSRFQGVQQAPRRSSPDCW